MSEMTCSRCRRFAELVGTSPMYRCPECGNLNGTSAGDEGFITTALCAITAVVFGAALWCVGLAMGTNTVETIPVPGPTVTVQTPGPVRTVEVTRTPDRASRGEERRVTTRTTEPGASGSTSPSRPSGRERPTTTPLTGWKADYWRNAQAWATTSKVRAVIHCESRNNPRAVSNTGKYRGLYQFDANKWASYGGLELAPTADRASREAQNYVAYRTYVGNGWAPWSCA